MQADTLVCPRCHEENALNAKFCIECGYDLQVAPETIMLRSLPNQTLPKNYSSPSNYNPTQAQYTPPQTHYAPPQSDYASVQYPLRGNNHFKSDDRTWASLAHLASLLGWFIPGADLIAVIVIWLSKRDSSAFINDQAKEALNYQISFYVYTFISLILACFYVGFFLLIILAVFDLVICLVAASKASQGVYYRYPGIIRFIQ